MQELQSVNAVRSQAGDTTGVSYFASQVVALLADRNPKSVIEPREELITGLISAAQSGAKSAFMDLLAEVKKSRISLAALADIYIPIAARRMGEAWHEDQMSWMDVSIGVGRLQSLLREIGAAWVADQAGNTGHGTVLFIVPDREQHTLGPMVATGQLRRYGVSVCLRIAPSPSELRNLLATRRFDGVLISVSTRDKLESVARAIQFLRTLTPDPIPIIVGGAVMTAAEELVSRTGADFSSNDVGAALEAIGLKFDALCVLKRA